MTRDARLCFLGDLRAYLIGILYRTALSRIQDDLSSSSSLMTRYSLFTLLEALILSHQALAREVA